MQTDALYYGDCLDWMQKWDDKSVDIIYLDPPFNSKATYNQLFQMDGCGDAQFRAFADTWVWDEAAADRLSMYENAPGRDAYDVIIGLKRILGSCGMLAYLSYMAERLEQMQRLLKDTGSIYLHCDPTASHYLKVLMDAIFTGTGKGKFLNEILWLYKTGGVSQRWFARKHDNILFYSKTNRYTFHPQKEKSYLKHRYGFSNIKVLQDSQGYYTEVGMRDYWDIPALRGNQPEAVGYPTQKPEALLERIIKASSNEGDTVLDPFCGCGTTVAVAKELKRQFIGIDISSFAIDLVQGRRLKDKTIPVYGIPQDLRSAEKLATENPFNFESWAITRLPGFVPNTKQVGDGGIDGRASIAHKPDDWDSKLALAQVKGGKFNLSSLRDFIHVTNREMAAIGCFVTLRPVTTPASRREIIGAGKVSIEQHLYPRMQIYSIEDYFNRRIPKLPAMNDPYTGRSMLPSLF